MELQPWQTVNPSEPFPHQLEIFNWRVSLQSASQGPLDMYILTPNYLGYSGLLGYSKDIELYLLESGMLKTVQAYVGL